MCINFNITVLSIIAVISSDKELKTRLMLSYEWTTELENQFLMLITQTLLAHCELGGELAPFVSLKSCHLSEGSTVETRSEYGLWCDTNQCHILFGIALEVW